MELSYIAMAFNGAFLVLSFLPLVGQFSQRLGSLVQTIEVMLADFALFFVILLMVSLAFGFFFLELHSTGYFGDTDVLDEVNGPLSLLLSAFFGELFIDKASWPGTTAVYLYALVANILLVNLLIAMFSDTYQRYATGRAAEYAYRKCVQLYVQRHIALTIPPPFNLPIVLYDLLCGFRTCRGDGGHRLTPTTAMRHLDESLASGVSDGNSPREDPPPESDPRDGSVLAEEFVEMRAKETAAADAVELRQEKMLSRLDALALRLERIERLQTLSNFDQNLTAGHDGGVAPSSL